MPTGRQRMVASITRRYPLYSGSARLANHSVVNRIAGVSAETTWAKVPGGYWVAAPMADYIGRAIFYFGDLDRKVTWVCSRLVRSGDCVLDIGANLGLVSLTLSALVGPTGQVHAFEPIPLMQSLIEQAIERNDVTNMKLHRFALGAQDGQLILSVPPRNVGSASFVPIRRYPDSTDVLVPVRTLSSIMADQNVDHVRLVKMDVEGFESEVLAGAVEFFSRRAPDAVVFELNDCTGDLHHHPTIVALSSLGYGFFALPRRLMRMRALRLGHQDLGSVPRCNDFVAARLGRIYEEVAQRLGAA
jgi:FkbM family methyltransferase